LDLLALTILPTMVERGARLKGAAMTPSVLFVTVLLDGALAQMVDWRTCFSDR
jgi:hypothetical protein